jgi:uncharacterized protein (TIGR02231 family)
MTQVLTKIVAATVYPERVRLTRRGLIKLEAGTHAIEITELPITIDPDSLNATVYGSATARLLGVQVRRVFYTDQPSDSVRDLEQHIEQTQDEITRLDAKDELIKQNKAVLDNLAGQVTTYATALAAGEMTVERQLQFFAKLRGQTEKLNEEALSIQRDQRKAQRLFEKLTKELEQIRNTLPRERYTAVVDIELPSASELTIEISYIASEAGWKPIYDLRLLEKEGNPTLEVAYLADVTQATGEIWEGISLTLSTAHPALTSTLPELDPWYIHPPEPIYPVVRLGVGPQTISSFDVNAKQTLPAAAPHEEQPQEIAEEATATLHTTGTSVSYIVQSAVTIQPNGDPHKVTISRFSLEPALDYVSAPKLAQSVFRRAKVENSSPYTLLAGEANILFIDEYVGTTEMKLTVPGGEIEVYLGSENRLKVERELKRRDIDKRVISGRRNQVFGYAINLESRMPNKVDLTLYDQLPVPRNEEIRVRLDLADPKPTSQTELSQLIWELSLEPKEQHTIRFDFSVESPQTMKIIGLP